MTKRIISPRLARQLLNLEFYSYEFSGQRSVRTGPKSNLTENIVYYLLATICRETPLPNRSRTLTWREIQGIFNKAVDGKQEEQNRKVISYYPRNDGTYFEVITPVDQFDAALGIRKSRPAHLSVSGLRYRVRQGKKLIDLVKQKREERPDLYPEISIRRAKKRATIIHRKEIVEVVRGNSNHPATILLHSKPVEIA